jgi:hypothetical protein
VLESDAKRGEEIERAVLSVLRKVGEERGIASGDFGKLRNLLDLGFKSVDLARIVALLEVRLGSDPFVHVPITGIRSVEDLIAAYVGLSAPFQAAPAPAAAPLRRDVEAASRRRAVRRGGVGE